MALGDIGSSYHCNLDGGYYEVTGKDAKGGYIVKKVDKPTADYTADNADWHNYHEGDITDPPAGAPMGYGSMKVASFAGTDAVGGGDAGGEVGGAPPPMGDGHQFTEQELISFFMSKGMSKEGAIGIVANLKAENGLRTDGAPASQGEEGLAQWKGPRLDALKSYAAQHGLDWHSKDAQLGYLWEELHQPQYIDTLNKVMHASSAEQAASDFCAGFEEPTMDDGTPNYATYGERKGIARDLAGKY